MAKLPLNLEGKLEKRRKGNAFRTLSPISDLVDFSSNDYLGFSREKRIAEMANEQVARLQPFQNGATGSRLLSGNHGFYGELEDFISSFHRSPAALIFNSGYDANLGFFSSVPQRGDIVLYDEYCHASIRDGIKLGPSKSYKFKHNSLGDLASHLKRSRKVHGKNPTIYVVTESVFSMDGDSPNLAEFAALVVDNGALLVVDEAHAMGIYGKGLMNTLGLEDNVFARIITFGKALGTHGAVILGNPGLRDFLINFCRSFIYTTALPLHTLATIWAAYRFFDSEQGRQRQQALTANIGYFKSLVVQKGLNMYFSESSSAVQVCRIGGNDQTKRLSSVLKEAGFDVRPILNPTVPQGEERLRFCLHAFNTRNEMESVLTMVKKHMLNEE